MWGFKPLGMIELHFGLLIVFSFLAVWQNVHTSIVIFFFFFVHDDLEAAWSSWSAISLHLKFVSYVKGCQDVFDASRPETALKKHDFWIL